MTDTTSANRPVSTGAPPPLYRPLGVLAICGFVAVAAATRHGVGIAPDQVNYLRAAANLLAGERMQVMQTFNFYGPVPMTTWPPVFPLLLAAVASLGVGVDEAARWLNALLFGANLFLVGVIVSRCTRSAITGLLAGALVLGSGEMVRLHLDAMSEPAFLFFGLLGILLLDRYLSSRRRSLFLASAGAIALAALTRYSGVGWIAAGVIVLLLLDSRSPYRRRFRKAVLWGAVASLPLALWLMRNQLVVEERLYDSITPTLGRSGEIVAVLLATLSRSVWAFPTPGLHRIHPLADQLLAAVALIALAGLVLTLLVAWPRVRTAMTADRRSDRLPAILLTFSLTQAVFLFAVFILFFPSTIVLPRQVFPVAVTLTLLAIFLLYRALTARVPRIAHVCAAVMLALVSIGHLARGSAEILWGYRTGIGFNSLNWQSSKMLEWAHSVDPDTPLFSNYALTVFFHTGHDARFLPRKNGFQWRATSEDPDSFGPNPYYRDQISDLRRQITDHNAIILYFNFHPPRKAFPTEVELKEQLSIKELVRLEDGVVYVLGPGPESLDAALISQPQTREPES